MTPHSVMQMLGPLSRGARSATRGQMRPHVEGLPASGIRPFWIPIITLTGLSQKTPASFEDSISLGSDFWLCAAMLNTDIPGQVANNPTGFLTFQLFRLTTDAQGNTVTESLQQKAVIDANETAEKGDTHGGIAGAPSTIVGLALEEMGGTVARLTPYNQALRPFRVLFGQGALTNPQTGWPALRPAYLKRALHLPADTTLQARVQFTAHAGVTLGELQLVLMGYIPE